jgi:hypothetical protein
MQKISKRDRVGTTTNFIIDRPKQVKPVITGEYTKNGVRYYKGEKKGQVYVADQYDAMFKTEKMEILPRHTKRD